jgi:hypothetical protein
MASHVVRSYLAAGVAFGQVFGGTQYNRAGQPIMMPVMPTSAEYILSCCCSVLPRAVSEAYDRIIKSVVSHRLSAKAACCFGGNEHHAEACIGS